MPLSLAERLLAPYPHGPVSVTFERLSTRLVFGVDLGHELVEIELAERVARAELHCFGRVSLSPRRLLADDDLGRPVGLQPVAAAHAGRADRLIRRFEDP